MQLSAVQKLLQAPEMARGMQHAAACEVQGRLLAKTGQRDDQNFVSSIAGVHTAPAD
jgi:hypothetical protein